MDQARASGLPQEQSHCLPKLPDVGGSAIVTLGADQRIVHASLGFTWLYGYEAGEAVGQSLGSLLAGPLTDESELHAMRDAAVAGQCLQVDALLYAKNGSHRWSSVVLNPVRGPSGQVESIVVVFADIVQKKIHEVLRHKVLNAMARGTTVGEVANLLCRQIESIAPEVQVAVLRADLNGALRLLAAPNLPEDLLALMDGGFDIASGSVLEGIVHPGKTAFWGDMSAHPDWSECSVAMRRHGLRKGWIDPIVAQDGGVFGALIFFFRDVHDRSPLHLWLAEEGVHMGSLLLELDKALRQAHQLTCFDPLTGLANRGMLAARAKQLLLDAKETHVPVAWVLVDLDRFKQFRDSHGYSLGDSLLQVVADRLKAASGGNDVVARLGADEFAIVVPHCDTLEAMTIAERLRSVVSQPANIDGVMCHPHASVGIAMYPEDGTDTDSLLRSANMAMYQAKTLRGGKVQFYSARLNQEATERSRLETDLRFALGQGGLTLHYQPLVTADGLLDGVEALLRWNHPTLGPIEPMRFVALAEERGLIDALTQWVVGEACRQMADWRMRALAIPHVAINLSPINLRNGGTPLMIATALQTNGLRPGDLRVEVTETALMDPHPSTLAAARALHTHGILLYLDDFGTGHSSLAVLHRLPISAIKLDKSFVQDLEHNAAARALTAAVQRIGVSLGIPVVAEGVENEVQLSFLSRCGCQLLQGYLFSRPLPAHQLEEWIAITQAGRPTSEEETNA